VEGAHGVKSRQTSPIRAQSAGAPVELTVVSPTFNERPNVRPLVQKLHQALQGVNWEVIFVDDNSPDGTAEEVKTLAAEDFRVRGLKRVGRRGLAGAVLEGAMASAAPYVVVIDADLQHDETILPQMLETLRAGDKDSWWPPATWSPKACRKALASRANAVAASPLAQPAGAQDRHLRSCERLLHGPARGVGEGRAQAVDRGLQGAVRHRRLAPGALRVAETPYRFRDRLQGESKLDSRVVVDYLGLILNKATRDVVPARAILFCAVGASGIVGAPDRPGAST